MISCHLTYGGTRQFRQCELAFHQGNYNVYNINLGQMQQFIDLKGRLHEHPASCEFSSKITYHTSTVNLLYTGHCSSIVVVKIKLPLKSNCWYNDKIWQVSCATLCHSDNKRIAYSSLFIIKELKLVFVIK